MNDPIRLRKLLREVLAFAPTRRIPESILFSSLNDICMDDLKHDEFVKTRNWNKAEGFIESRFNKDLDQDEWGLTDAGKQKEGL